MDLLGEGNNKICLKTLPLLSSYCYLESCVVSNYPTAKAVCLLNKTCVFPGHIPSPHSCHRHHGLSQRKDENPSLKTLTTPSFVIVTSSNCH